MSCCNCGQPKKLCRCPQKGEAPQRAYIAECTDCDPCRPCESMVKICSFIAPTLTDGQRFRNSFIYNQEDDTVYYIDNSGTPTRFGSSPMFINNFNPDDRSIPRQTVFDFSNSKAYVYSPDGEYKTFVLDGSAPTPVDQKLEVTLDDFDSVVTPSEAVDGAVEMEYIVTLRNDEGLTPIQIFDAYGAGRQIVFKNIPTMIDNTNYMPVFSRTDGNVTTTYGGSFIPTFYQEEVLANGNNVEGYRFLSSSPVNPASFTQNPISICLQFEKESDVPVLERAFVKVFVRVEA